MAAKQVDTFKPQDPHVLNEKEHQYIQAMNPEQRQLHELAIKMLGSSYFVGKTHGYTKWLKSLTPNTQSQGAK
jgi:hypothetical protein